MLQIFSISAVTIFIFMVIVYLRAQSVQNNSIVDIGWGLGFVVVTLVLVLYSGGTVLPVTILSFMILFWGMRLSFHIFSRNIGKPEDFRYANWRKEWGKKQAWISFWKVFMLQGLIMLVLSLPIMLVFYSYSTTLRLANIPGIILFIAGLFIESRADNQLKKFKANPANKNKIITSGLWKYSRHPNYFGESLLWWGIGIYSFSVSGFWYCLFSPLVLTFLLRYVSGVPMLEEKYKDRADFREYASRTPVFVPFIGKRKSFF